MILFTPNTVIKSADVNLNFAQVTDIENKRAIMTISFSTSPVTMGFAVAWTFYKVALNQVQSSYDPAGLLSLSSNGIKIGAGVSAVKVCGTYAWYNNGGEADMQAIAFKNSSQTGSSSYFNGPATIDYMTMPVSLTTVPVVENDIIYLYATQGGTGNRSLFGFTSLTVEVIA